MPKIFTKLLFQQSKSESGFTLMEVLVASLVVVFFVVGSLQALALSVAIRVKAQARQRADQLIQEDIEAVRHVAENMVANQSLCSANGFAGGYAQALSADAAFPASTSTKRLFEDNANSRQYQLTRTIDTTNSSNTILKLSYSVSEVGNNTEITTDYIEVIPNAATLCP